MQARVKKRGKKTFLDNSRYVARGARGVQQLAPMPMPRPRPGRRRLLGLVAAPGGSRARDLEVKNARGVCSRGARLVLPRPWSVLRLETPGVAFARVPAMRSKRLQAGVIPPPPPRSAPVQSLYAIRKVRRGMRLQSPGEPRMCAWTLCKPPAFPRVPACHGCGCTGVRFRNARSAQSRPIHVRDFLQIYTVIRHCARPCRGPTP